MLILRLDQYLVLLGLAGFATALILGARKLWQKNVWLRTLGAVVLTPPAAVAALFTTLFALSMVSCESHSPAVYSPDHRKAAMSWNFDGGALGGGSSVIVYRMHGFYSQVVFGGDWKSTDAGKLQWIDNTHLQISYDADPGSKARTECHDAGSVSVRCIAVSEK